MASTKQQAPPKTLDEALKENRELTHQNKHLRGILVGFLQDVEHSMLRSWDSLRTVKEIKDVGNFGGE